MKHNPCPNVVIGGSVSQFLVWFDSGKLRYSHRFADLGSRAPRICLFFSNLIPIGYAGKYRGGRKFRHKPCQASPGAVSKKSTLTKRKNRPQPNSKGETLSRFQITALNTLKNVFGRCISVRCLALLYFFQTRLLCKSVFGQIHTPAQRPGGKYLILEN